MTPDASAWFRVYVTLGDPSDAPAPNHDQRRRGRVRAFDSSDETWLQQIVSAAAPLISDGLGALAYSIAGRAVRR